MSEEKNIPEESFKPQAANNKAQEKALLIPVHHRLEKWITQVIVEKNKKSDWLLRKKTIEKLEPKSGS